MSDRDDKDFDISGSPELVEDTNSATKNEKDFSPVEAESDLSDTPAVSITKKKNAVIFIAGFGLIMFLVYSMLDSGPKKVVKTEGQKMALENREKSGVPRGDLGNVNDSDSGSVNNALPGDDSVPVMPAPEKKSQQQYGIEQTLPPPPTMPPLFDPNSMYVSADGGGANYDQSLPPAAREFGNRYTKKRSKMPDYSPSIDGESDLEDMSDLDPETQKKLEEERKKRISANMFVGGNSSGGLAIGAESNSKDAVSTEEEFVLNESSASKTDVTIRKDLNSVILQGKVIDAVIETAINTDLPGTLRGIISRDVYSESGKRIVIPKGSRLIGSYATDVKFGQARVYVIWTRVIRPDGVDAVLDSTGDMVAIDALGRSGVYGQLDNRFFEIFGSSILMSSLTIAFAVAADAASGGDSANSTTTTQSVTGSTTTTNNSAISQGVRQAVGDLGSTTKNVVEKYFKTTPRISVDQGSKIKVFVNKDIIFPPAYFSSGTSNNGTEFLN